MSNVIAAHVRKIDPPQFVAEDIEELLAKVGEDWSGEQCDSCGNCLYIIKHDPAFELDRVRKHNVANAFYVECTRDDDEDLPEGVGCGTEYRLRWYDESQVCF
jgi:hypothetical protein